MNMNNNYGNNQSKIILNYYKDSNMNNSGNNNYNQMK